MIKTLNIKKIVLSVLVLTAAALAAVFIINNSANVAGAAAVACTPPPAGVVSWWPGDGNANDIQGTNHGTLQNGATFSLGKVNQAFSLDGLDDFVNVGPGISFGTLPDFSIETWVKFNSLNSAGQWQTIISQEDVGLFVAVQINVDENERLETKVGDGQFLTGITTLQPGVFYHVALTKDSTGNVKLYLNGNLEGTVAAGPLDTTNQNLQIGRWSRKFDGKTAYWGGQIDEVSIYNRALTPIEIAAIFPADSAGKCKAPPDADADGVPDELDQCPLTAGSPGLSGCQGSEALSDFFQKLANGFLDEATLKSLVNIGDKATNPDSLAWDMLLLFTDKFEGQRTIQLDVLQLGADDISGKLNLKQTSKGTELNFDGNGILTDGKLSQRFMTELGKTERKIKFENQLGQITVDGRSYELKAVDADLDVEAEPTLAIVKLKLNALLDSPASPTAGDKTGASLKIYKDGGEFTGNLKAERKFTNGAPTNFILVEVNKEKTPRDRKTAEDLTQLIRVSSGDCTVFKDWKRVTAGGVELEFNQDIIFVPDTLPCKQLQRELLELGGAIQTFVEGNYSYYTEQHPAEITGQVQARRTGNDLKIESSNAVLSSGKMPSNVQRVLGATQQDIEIVGNQAVVTLNGIPCDVIILELEGHADASTGSVVGLGVRASILRECLIPEGNSSVPGTIRTVADSRSGTADYKAQLKNAGTLNEYVEVEFKKKSSEDKREAKDAASRIRLKDPVPPLVH